MRIIHTADWHLGKLVNGYSMIEDQRVYFKKFIDQVRDLKADALIMSGDLYDRVNPSQDAIELANEILTQLVSELGLEVFFIAGNHDSPDRIEYGSQLFRESGLHIAGRTQKIPRSILKDNVRFWLLPFASHTHIRRVLEDDTIRNLNDATAKQIESIKENWNPLEKNILIFHGYVIQGGPESVETSDSERPLSIGTAEYVSAQLFEDFDYVALGHLHQPQNVLPSKVRYAGSPLKYSASEIPQKKSFTVVELVDDQLEIETHEVEPLRELRYIEGKMESLLEEKSNDYVFIRLTDEDYQLDAMNRLKQQYPYAMALEYVKRQSLEVAQKELKQEDLKEHSTLELFNDFYEHYSERSLDSKRMTALSILIDEIKEEEGLD